MCGIAGAFDLRGRRDFPRDRLRQMTAAIAHRGPDEEGTHLEPGLALGSRRLAIIDRAGGAQPLANENGHVWVSFEGEWYDHEEQRADLIAKHHRFKTRCDTEVWVHAYEEVGEQVFEKARGQFSVALWDQRERKLLLARDRFGIGPLFYAVHDGWLLWASEVKGLLASGVIQAQPDRRAIDYAFNFFVQPLERTCFDGINQIAPGHFLRAKDGQISTHQYWDLDFPDAGSERPFQDAATAAQELEQLLRAAVRRRLVGEVPISCYLSGGLDSTTMLALCTQESRAPVPSFTIGLDRAGPADERDKAAESARVFGSPNTTVNVTEAEIVRAYPNLIAASEAPVIDTSAACMLYLARANRAAGNIVAITGEGADEALAGYVWFKTPTPTRVQERLNRPLEQLARLVTTGLIGGSTAHRPAFRGLNGLRVMQQLSWEIAAQSREYLYSNEMWRQLTNWSAYDEVKLPAERIKRWHPLNQAIYVGYKTLLPGLLLAGKGDRPLRAASTEGRYPFLDEQVVDFCSALPPHYKLRRLTDKWLLRKVAASVAPHQIGSRRKTMFRATMSPAFLRDSRPAWVDQLLSPASLTATGYFDPLKVSRAREIQRRKSKYSLQRFSLDLGLIAVISTQLWHHTFCGGGLADLDTWTPAQPTGHSAAVPKPHFLKQAYATRINGAGRGNLP
jgi:asparagine synthase (glutamine-hydrolysing)